ncbi:MAG: hypothetical protein E6G47_09915 [Actinobacteria bacterium]|nr:MAG: hypothetical protein E6G47_09915 [Actinomycetota bacterium]
MSRPSGAEWNGWWRAARALGHPLLGAAFRLRFSGIEHVPRTGGALIASNHVSVLDPVFVVFAASRRGRVVRYLTVSDAFDQRVVGWGLRRVQQIDCSRRGARRDLGRGDGGRRTRAPAHPEGRRPDRARGWRPDHPRGRLGHPGPLVQARAATRAADPTDRGGGVRTADPSGRGPALPRGRARPHRPAGLGTGLARRLGPLAREWVGNRTAERPDLGPA